MNRFVPQDYVSFALLRSELDTKLHPVHDFTRSFDRPASGRFSFLARPEQLVSYRSSVRRNATSLQPALNVSFLRELTFTDLDRNNSFVLNSAYRGSPGHVGFRETLLTACAFEKRAKAAVKRAWFGRIHCNCRRQRRLRLAATQRTEPVSTIRKR